MAFYVRYFDAEALLPKDEDIITFMSELNVLSQREMEILGSYMGKLKNGTNRIFLDKTKKRYILAIGTDKTDIAEFQKNAKQEARPTPKNVRQEQKASQKTAAAVENPNLGWFIYTLEYQRFEEGVYLPYKFKAKILDASLLSAYQQMADYLTNQHKECMIPDFYPGLLTVEPVVE